MNRFITRANKKLGVSSAATLLLVISLIGQVLGFLRYKIVNANFPTFGPESTDAYFAAFKIPDFFFYTLAAGALGVAFIPILAEQIEKGNPKKAWELTGSLLNLLAVIMLFTGVIIVVFAEPLVRAVAPGLQGEELQNAVTIMKLIAFNPLLFTISGILAGAQQAFGRFFFYAVGPIFYNVSIMASVYIFKDSMGIVGLGVGALAGGILQLLIVSLGVIGASFHWRPQIMWRSTDFRRILRLLPARSIDQGVDSINSIVETNRASKLGAGNISYYENAFILHTTPIILFGNTISTAAYPKLTERLAQHRPDLFRKEFLQVLRAIIWLTLPVAVISYFARGYFARLIFTNSAPEIAVVFGYFAAAIFFRSVYAMLSRWFYAQKDTMTPLIISLFVIALNIVLAYLLSRPTAYGIVGLAIAQSIVAAVEVVILMIVMIYRDRKLLDKKFWGALLKMLSVTGFSVLAAFVMISLLPLLVTDRGFITLGAKLATISGVTIAVYVVFSWIFELEEVRPIITRTKRIVQWRVRV
jgi:putative peptidoglycan lipid II flippase